MQKHCKVLQHHMYGRTRVLVTEYNALEPEAYCCCRHSLHAIAAAVPCTRLHWYRAPAGGHIRPALLPNAHRHHDAHGCGANTPDVDILLRDTCGTAYGTLRLGLLTCIFTARVLTCCECAITEISLTLLIAACAEFSCTSSAANALAGSCQQLSL